MGKKPSQPAAQTRPYRKKPTINQKQQPKHRPQNIEKQIQTSIKNSKASRSDEHNHQKHVEHGKREEGHLEKLLAKSLRGT